MPDIEDTIASIKDKLPDITPTPPKFHTQATAHELKSRLNLGEPALTILDARDNDSYRHHRILGAMNLSIDSLQQGVKPSVELDRDIYIYGASDDDTAMAANLLRELGYTRVAELKGGLEDWRAIGGSIEGIDDKEDRPGADDFNVVSRLQQHSREQQIENSMKSEQN